METGRNTSLKLPVLAAALGILAFLPVNFYFLGFVFLAPFFIFLLLEQKFWRLILGSLIFRFAFALGTVYYTLEPFAWGSSLLIFLSLPIAIFLIKKAMGKYEFDKRTILAVLLAAMPALWTLMDHAAAKYALLPTYIITTGNVFGSSPFLGLANIVGLWGLTFFAATINILFAAVFLSGYQKNNFRFGSLKIWASLIMVILFAGVAVSNIMLRRGAADYGRLPRVLRFVAVSFDDNLRSDDLENLKRELKEGGTADLIVFGEDALANLNLESGAFFKSMAIDAKTNVIASYDVSRNGRKYNSSILFNEKGDIVGQHDKSRLAFIGEYWPFGGWHPFFFDWLKKNNPKITDYAIFGSSHYETGTRNILTLPSRSGASSKFAVLICLEGHYPQDLADYKKSGAEFLIEETSNRWINFGLGHLIYLTNNLRKIESVSTALPVIVSGIDDSVGMITPDGVAYLNHKTGQNHYRIFSGEIRLRGEPL